MQPPALDTACGAARTREQTEPAQPFSASERKTPSDSKYHPGTADARHMALLTGVSRWALVSHSLVCSHYTQTSPTPNHPRQKVRQQHRNNSGGFVPGVRLQSNFPESTRSSPGSGISRTASWSTFGFVTQRLIQSSPVINPSLLTKRREGGKRAGKQKPPAPAEHLPGNGAGERGTSRGEALDPLPAQPGRFPGSRRQATQRG